MLISQSELDLLNSKFLWARTSIRHVLSKFDSEAGTRNGFPCIFAQNAIKRGNVRFLLIPHDSKSGKYELDVFAEGLRTCINEIDVEDLDINRHRPLLVLFEPVSVYTSNDHFRQIFIEAMQFLIDHDHYAWPAHIPKIPTDKKWTMCYHGCELFVNVSHPAHVLRRSRKMGPGIAFVVNPRKIFDIAAPADRQGELITAKIRANLDIYDDLPHSPLLGSYVLNEGQWQQYMITDNNDDNALQCPLHIK